MNNDPGTEQNNDGMSDDDRAFLAAMNETDDGQPPQPPAEPDPAVQPPAEENHEPPVDTGENGTQPPEQDSWLAALPEEHRNRIVETESANRRLQQELAQQRNDHAAMAGKLRPLQQKLAELERTQRESAATAPVANAAPQTDEDLDALLETPEFAEWAQTFPEDAKVWRANQKQIIKVAGQIAERQVTQVKRELEDRFGPVISRVQTSQQETDRLARIAQLEAAHPDWQQHSASDEFSSWFNDQYIPSLPSDIRRSFEDPRAVARALNEPQYAARVLTEFKRDTGKTNAPPAPAPAPPPGNQPVDPRLLLASNPAVPAPPSNSRMRVDQMDPDAAFRAGFNSPD